MDILLFSASVLLTTSRSWLHSRKPTWAATPEDALVVQALQNRTSLNAEERICVVTEDNCVVPEGSYRADMRLHNLWHRATYVLVHHHHQEELHEPPHDQSLDTTWEDNYVLVQRRSMRKDYCPGKLDPTPGGVVGFGEAYRENALREIQEEMGISVQNEDCLHRLFTFHYSDERVRVWGDLYEFTYSGSLHDLVLQQTEVDEVIRMSLKELYTRIETRPDDFMPDSCHAMRLYFQRRRDVQVQRRLLKGYSSGDLDRYGLRPKPQAIFFDCDDCLYFDSWKTATQLTNKIDEWCTSRGLLPGQAYELYKQYGTALRGLLAEGYLENNEQDIDAYLEYVHDIPIADLLGRDDALRAMLLAIDPSIPKYIFTASVRQHAHRCLTALGIEDLFVDIVDCKTCDLETKHATHSFRAAMAVAGVDCPEACLFLDDNLVNIQSARHVGWRSVLVGRTGRDLGNPVTSEHAELEIASIHHLRHVLPEIFA
jgi:pyrimidine 5'-nucleotidase